MGLSKEFLDAAVRAEQETRVVYFVGFNSPGATPIRFEADWNTAASVPSEFAKQLGDHLLPLMKKQRDELFREARRFVLAQRSPAQPAQPAQPAPRPPPKR